MGKRSNPWRTKSNTIVISFTIIVAIIVLYQMIFIPSLRSATGLPSSMVMHEGKIWDFSIQHPKSWTPTELIDGDHGDDGVIGYISSPHGFIPGVKIASREMIIGTIEDALHWGVDRINDCDSYQPGTLVDVSVSRVPAIKFDYTCIRRVSFIPKREGRVLCNDYYLINDQLAYALTFCAEEKNWAEVEKVFDEMISSFTLK